MKNEADCKTQIIPEPLKYPQTIGLSLCSLSMAKLINIFSVM